ncbi:hypothetical protein GCM10025865_21660 [Paraoerskovia sediminicola]|uniref:Uncharacterized protein n=1 Tax=Paraoerskovia sediminicola TaxID=1138587 RepID=A0ABM8G405_9CELL|nr:hypothetical protein [Paraoerskovia sediminicola]BDZ42867.1 hypothetical protein GCM10025865_21660 [Paraoerskovia sediminicola]
MWTCLFAADELELAERAFDRIEEILAGPGAGAWSTADREMGWARRWHHARKDRSSGPTPQGRVAFGVIDYAQPGRAKASQNIGDQVQTLASLGHVVRHQNLKFHGDPELVSFVEGLQGRVRPELALDSTAAEIDLVRVDRDASSYHELSEPTWLLEFGWHMHSLLNKEVWDFPFTRTSARSSSRSTATSVVC